MIKKIYVIGSKVSESLSPLIFNYWFKKNKINAEYNFKEILPKNFNKEIDFVLQEKSVCGFNVTIPYKELIIEKIDGIDKHSKKIGAVNFVTKKNNKWVGKNTDWTGFLKPLKSINRKKEDVVVIGYGGAAKAIIYALQSVGFSKINVFNRTYKKIIKLESSLDFQPIKNFELKKYLEKSSLIVNTSPINILKNLENLKLLKDSVGYDVVYRPKNTNFLSNFKFSNRIYGIDMLISQAAPCYEEWFGKKPIIDKGLYGLLEKKI